MNTVLAEPQTPSQNPSSHDSIPLGSVPATIAATPHFGFRIGALGFLFPENCPGEVLTGPEICPIPHTRDWMPGVISLRGNLIPVFDLHDWLFQTPVSVSKPMILILDRGKQAMGFVLQEPPEWLTGLTTAPLAIASVPELIADQVSSVYRRQETVWLEFNKTIFFAFLAESAKTGSQNH